MDNTTGSSASALQWGQTRRDMGKIRVNFSGQIEIICKNAAAVRLEATVDDLSLLRDYLATEREFNAQMLQPVVEKLANIVRDGKESVELRAVAVQCVAITGVQASEMFNSLQHRNGVGSPLPDTKAFIQSLPLEKTNTPAALKRLREYKETLLTTRAGISDLINSCSIESKVARLALQGIDEIANRFADGQGDQQLVLHNLSKAKSRLPERDLIATERVLSRDTEECDLAITAVDRIVNAIQDHAKANGNARVAQDQNSGARR